MQRQQSMNIINQFSHCSIRTSVFTQVTSAHNLHFFISDACQIILLFAFTIFGRTFKKIPSGKQDSYVAAFLRCFPQNRRRSTCSFIR